MHKSRVDPVSHKKQVSVCSKRKTNKNKTKKHQKNKTTNKRRKMQHIHISQGHTNKNAQEIPNWEVMG